MKIRVGPRAGLMAVLLAADGLFFTLTNPAHLPSFVWIVGLGLLMTTLYSVLFIMLGVSDWYGLPFRRHRRRLAGMITGLTAGLLALESIGQLTMRDALVLLPFVVIVYLYSSYNGSKRASSTEP